VVPRERNLRAPSGNRCLPLKPECEVLGKTGKQAEDRRSNPNIHAETRSSRRNSRNCRNGNLHQSGGGLVVKK
jgi:hypothetical protein